MKGEGGGSVGEMTCCPRERTWGWSHRIDSENQDVVAHSCDARVAEGRWGIPGAFLLGGLILLLSSMFSGR